MTDTLTVAHRGGASTLLTLNRPQKVNALDADLVERMLAALAQARRDGARLVVLRGAGKGFSAGFDFGGLIAQSDGDLVLRFIRLEQLLQSVSQAPFMTLALVHGPCFGAAADLVAACTHRIATADARFRMPGLRFGIALGTRRLAHVVGADAARSVLATSRIFEAEEALRMRFLTAMCEVDGWEDQIEHFSREAAALPADSLARMLSLTRADTGAEDMAALVDSLAEPGLKNRIEAYLASLKKS